MKAFDYAIASTIPGALKALGKGYRPKGAGLDLLDRLKERTATEEKIVSIAGIAELGGISDDGLRIGPLATLEQVAEHPVLGAKFPGLADAAGSAATPQVRASATVGGNLCQRPRCWYFRNAEFQCLKRGGNACHAVDGENTYHAIFGGGPCHIVHPSNLGPALVAADAQIDIAKADGTKRTVAAKDFFVSDANFVTTENVLQPGELITAIRFAALPKRSAFVALKEKQSFDWPLAFAVVAEMEDGWRVQLGAVAPTPWRAERAEALLKGKSDITPELAEQAAEAALHGAKPLAQNAFRLRIAKAAVRRALLAAVGNTEAI